MTRSRGKALAILVANTVLATLAILLTLSRNPDLPQQTIVSLWCIICATLNLCAYGFIRYGKNSKSR